MTCAWCRERLDDRIDGLLSRADDAEVERHLAACAACAAEARARMRLEDLLARSARVPDHVPSAERLLVRVSRRPSLPSLARGWAVAAAVLLAFFAGWPSVEERRPAVPPVANTADPAPIADRTIPPVEEEAPPVDWLARLRQAADAKPGEEQLALLSVLRQNRARWEPAYAATLRTGTVDAAWLGLAVELGADGARPALRRLLADPGSRPDALRALARMRDPHAIAAATAGLAAGPDRIACLDALVDAQPERAVDRLLNALDEPTLAPTARARLEQVPKALDAELGARLAARDRRTQRDALARVAELGRKDLARAIHPLLNGPLRAEAASALLELRDPNSIAPLVAAMGEPALAERIAPGLAAFGPAGAARLRELLRTGSPTLRSRAAAVLGLSGDRSAGPALCALLGNSATRRIAIAALGTLGDPGTIRCLEPFLADPAFAADALAAIAAIGGEAALAPMVRAAARHATSREALEALGRLGFSKALPVLVSGLGNAYTAATAARSLGRLGDRKAVPALIGALGRPEARDDALAALREITDQDLGGNPAAWRSWWRDHSKGSDLPRPAVREG